MNIKREKNLLGLFVGFAPFSFPLNVFATTYSSDVEVQFNFNSEISIVVDHADIEILDLTPGASKDSNIIGITVSTNNLVGYTASATVGSSQNATTNMTHTNGANTFASIATDASLASLTTDNTWGYSTSTDNGTSWANLSGLPLYTDTAKQIAYTDSPASDDIKFKINAKAATSQPAGDYTNVINFNVVANVPPRDFTDILTSTYCTDYPEKCDSITNKPSIQSIDEDVCEAVEAYDTQFQVTDIRDHKNYWISKLRDDHCWMTQNLDLDLDSTVVYTNANTDLGWTGMRYNTASWQPSNSTIDATNGTITGWSTSNTAPFSVDPGEWYYTDTWYAASQSTGNYMAGDTGGKFKNGEQYEGNQEHGSVGNFYNWTAAIASNNSSSYNSSTYDNPSSNPQASICPTNWRLPVIATYTAGGTGGNELYNLEYLYHDDTYGATTYGLFSSPIYMVRAGTIDGGSLSAPGYYGYLWSSTVGNSSQTYYSSFSSSGVGYGVGAADYRGNGNSVRCLVRTKNQFIVSFNANGGTGTMTSQSIKYGQSAQLSANTFTREGYIFNGWNTDPDGLGVGYGDGDSYEVPVTSTASSVTLYAQWTQNGGGGGGGSGGSGGTGGRTLQRAFEVAYNKNPGAFDLGGGKSKHGLYYPVGDGTYAEATDESYYQRAASELRFAMQDIKMTFEEDGVTYKVCDYATVVGSWAYVLDLRDFKSYYITKLKDGNCWMSQNLDLNLSTSKTLDHETSDLGWEPTAFDATASWTPSVSTYSGSMTSVPDYKDSSIDRNMWYQPRSADIGDVVVYPTYNNFGYITYNSLADCRNDNKDEDECIHYETGNFYNYPAATASNNSRNTPATQIGSSYYYVIHNSICPAGWRLPMGVTGSSKTAEQSSELIKLLLLYNAGTPTYDGTSEKISSNASMDFILSKPLYIANTGVIAYGNNGIGALSAGTVSSWYKTGDTLIGQYMSMNNRGKVTSMGGKIEDYYRTVRCVAR